MLKVFKNIEDIELKENIDLGPYSTMKIKAKGHILLVKSIQALKEVYSHSKKENIDLKILGLGANQVLKNEGVYLKLKLRALDDLSVYQKEYHLDASISLNKITSAARKFNLSGWEVITGIPATLGGAIAMNAGTRLGEIKDINKDITVLREDLNIEKIIPDGESFSYRGNHFLSNKDIIISATLKHFGQKEGIKEEILEYLNKRKKDQPWGTANCGCVFKNKNFISAGKAIDLLGLKGFSYKGLKVSNIHANFIENESANYKDLTEFLDYLNYSLETFYGEKFELEVKID